MIIDYLEHAELYKNICPNLFETIEFAKTVENAEPGRYDFGDCFVLVQTIETQYASEKDFERHQKYLDVHIVSDGEEFIEYETVEHLCEKTDFDTDNDCQLLTGKGQGFILRPNMFCVVFPHDGHKPGCCVHNPSVIKKLVLKIPV
ncbi:MAG: YhcH/YjgK/YiaL family protein [Spirochaetales bacterium]